MFISESRCKTLIFGSRYRDVNFLPSHSSNGLVCGNTTRTFVWQQSIKNQ